MSVEEATAIISSMRQTTSKITATLYNEATALHWPATEAKNVVCLMRAASIILAQAQHEIDQAALWQLSNQHLFPQPLPPALDESGQTRL